ncbi:hypothetical protein HCJ07_11570 [Listeria booriae]|uniref:putative mucin/carbohydrate-binding domain-containing protein n=1 Tax=Listeria booriae TaxID=1552123 RepID=UPI00183AF40A|nr:putative mucin/carbohydrate-binding domain-containing protein [Listeria booriae]MBC1530986.1 hypothetical protein [Listeria booriae]
MPPAVEIFDEKGQSVFNHVMNGAKTETGIFEANIKPGYTIKVTHEEPSRISSLNASPVLVNNAITNTLQVTKYGLASEQKKVTAQDALANYKEKLEKLATSIRQNSAITSEDYSVPKTQLKKAIAYLADTDTDKIKYQQDYAELLALKNDTAQNLMNGDKFRFEIKGLSSQHFANIDLDLVAKKAEITNVTKVVHIYFNNVYASVKIYTPKGKQVVSKEYIGNKNVPASKEEVGIGVGYYVTITHQEPDRLVFTNTETEEIYNSYYMEQTYLVTEDGLKKVDAKQIPTPNPNEFDGSHFQFEFQGLSNVRFALMTLDFTNKQAKIQQNAGQPHFYFPGTYASIEIHDARGKLVYKKAYGGQEKLVADMFNVKIGTGYYVTVTHCESDDRLKITNTDTKELFPYCKAATYKITEEGLVKVATSDIPAFSSDYIDGDVFQFKFQGLSYWNFANVTLNLSSMELTFDKKAGQPHVYFDKNYPYATLQVKDKDGSEVYSYTMIGNENTGALLKKLALEQGYYIVITHREAEARLPLIVDNVLQEVQQNPTVYQIGADGLVKKTLTDIPTPTRFVNQKIYSANIDFTFRGFADYQFAKLHVDKEKNMLHLDVNAIQPHFGFGTTSYASITVKDDKGNVVFTKDFIGNMTQQEASLDIPIKDGYTIQVNHREPSTVRLEVKDNEKNKVHQMITQNEFLVVPNGLIAQ